jgi:hypothetical protein
MASGTSVRGDQLLLEQGLGSSRHVFIKISGEADIPPYRVGFCHACAVDGSPVNQTLVVGRNPVYAPGTFFKILDYPYGSGNNMRVFVDWNLEGLSWECYFF